MISETVKFGCEKLLNLEGIVFRKFTSCVYICIMRLQSKHFRAKSGCRFGAKYKFVQNLSTSHGNIFHILQHSATKLRSFNYFKMLFLAVILD